MASKATPPVLRAELDRIDMEIAGKKAELLSLNQYRAALLKVYCEGAGIPLHGVLDGNSLLVQVEQEKPST